jgi:hypothetical protein
LGLALAAAVQDQQVERAGRGQVAPVAGAHVNPVVAREHPGAERCPRRVTLDAGQPGVRVRAAGEPGQTHAAACAGLTDRPGAGAAGEDPQQPALLGQAGVREAGASGGGHRGGHQRRQVRAAVVRCGT